MNLTARILLSLLLATTAASAQGKNLLFYGNSFTYYVWGFGVPEMVALIATEAGHPTPTIVQETAGGATLGFHATDPAQVAAISTALPAGQTWDHVIMQGRGPEATAHGGFDPIDFRNNAVAIASNVRNHSPLATAVMYQTWAMAWGHMYYPVPWPTPMEMHNELRTNHQLAASDISATFGAGAGLNSAVGDAIALLEFDAVWYEADKGHPTPKMIALAAMCLYSTMYGQTVCEITPDFSPGSPLELALLSRGVTEADWDLLASVADRSAAPATRRSPGSGDHLMLESATGTDPLTACPLRQVTLGTTVQLQLRSMNGVYDNAFGLVFVDLFTTGSPPGPSPNWPEIQIDIGRSLVLNASGSLGTPISLSLTMPFTLPGASFLVQGLAWQASDETGNANFTTTDAHELVMF